MSLRDLDARVVPRAAAGLRALLDGAAERRSRVPQLGLLLAATLLLAGAGAALSSLEDGAPGRQTVAEGAQRPALGLLLGPPVGADADTHLAQSAQRLADLEPAARHLALVSLRSALTPEQTGALLDRAGLVLERAYLRAEVPGRPEEVLFQTPGDVVTGLQQVFGATAMRKADDQRDLLATAATLAGGTEQEAQLKARYEQDAGTAGAEAAAYRAGCACVFALVVNGDVLSLLGLLDLPEVRGVEAAPRGAAVAALSVRPLRPSETGTIQEDAT